MQNYFIEIGWQNHDVTLDISAFLLDAKGKVRSETGFVFYGTPKSQNGTIITPNGCIELSTPKHGESCMVRMDVALHSIPGYVTKIVFVAAVYHIDHPTDIMFGQVNGSYIRIVNKNNENELGRYELQDDCDGATVLEFCGFCRTENTWDFSILGDACLRKLPEIASKYGVRIPDHRFDRMYEQRMKDEEEKRKQREEEERRRMQAERKRAERERLEKEKQEREKANEIRKKKAEEKRHEHESIVKELIILCSECSQYHEPNTENMKLKTDFSDTKELLAAVKQDTDVERLEAVIREAIEKLRKLKTSYDSIRGRKSYLFWRQDSWTRWDTFINRDLFTIEFRNEIAKILQK